MRASRSLPAATIIAFAVLVLAVISRDPDEMVSGAAKAVDGDSLSIDGRMMRLKGIDAPEIRQTCSISGQTNACGREASRALQRWLTRGPAVCVGNETDRYGRLLVVCRVNGVDIGADLVKNGMAVDYGGYRAEEADARAAYRGVWAGSFERPEAYRKRTREEKSRMPGT